MRISRVFVPAPLEASALLEVDGETSHYLKTVLRLRKGWKVVVFDGQGTECPATVESFGRDSTGLRLETPFRVNRESPLKIHLALGISRGERMDLAIQKAVELGVDRITPLLTEFCVVRLDEEKKALRRAHWERVMRSALEQCGRNVLPSIDAPLAYETWLASHQGAALILDPEAKVGLMDLPRPGDTLSLLIGPEGGLSEQERSDAIASGLTGVRLGPRILRTETAVIAAISAVQTLWGDLGEVDTPSVSS
jgi:16S rRNA (uracil1498-N3)-methyltransferase